MCSGVLPWKELQQSEVVAARSQLTLDLYHNCLDYRCEAVLAPLSGHSNDHEAEPPNARARNYRPRLPNPFLQEYASTPWNDNSCWLDVVFETLFIISLEDPIYWTDPLPPDEEPWTRLQDLQRTFLQRQEIYERGKVGEIPGLLKRVRNGFQMRLGEPTTRPLVKYGVQSTPWVILLWLLLQAISCALNLIAVGVASDGIAN
jgi:hypothetical protein